MKRRILLIPLLFFLFVLISGCGRTTLIPITLTTNTYDYHQFPQLILSETSQQLSQPEEDYYLYFYSSSCTACLDVKGEVLAKLMVLSTDRVYLVSIQYSEDIDPRIHVTGIPAFVHVVNHEVHAIEQGATNVRRILGEIN